MYPLNYICQMTEYNYKKRITLQNINFNHNAMPGLLHPLEITQYPRYWWLGGHGACLIVAIYLAPTGIRSPDCPAHSESLYAILAHRNGVVHRC